MDKITAGFALCGSFCTFSKVIPQLTVLKEAGIDIVPIMSYAASTYDTRFGTAKEFRETIESVCGRKIIDTIYDAEPIGPQKLLDILVIEPCTGNTLGKMANGITDTPVTMAAKSHLRNSRPVLIGVSTNDALGAAAKNIGYLMNCKNIYFIPMKQDNCTKKPNSVVADFNLTLDALNCALNGVQMQPVLL